MAVNNILDDKAEKFQLALLMNKVVAMSNGKPSFEIIFSLLKAAPFCCFYKREIISRLEWELAGPNKKDILEMTIVALNLLITEEIKRVSGILASTKKTEEYDQILVEIGYERLNQYREMIKDSAIKDVNLYNSTIMEANSRVLEILFASALGTDENVDEKNQITIPLVRELCRCLTLLTRATKSNVFSKEESEKHKKKITDKIAEITAQTRMEIEGFKRAIEENGLNQYLQNYTFDQIMRIKENAMATVPLNEIKETESLFEKVMTTVEVSSESNKKMTFKKID